MFIKVLMLALSISIAPGSVTDINTLSDCDEVTVAIEDGNMYSFFTDSGDYSIDDHCILVFHNDEIINAF